MVFAQTVDAQGEPVHRPGKGSYHQIGLVRGQFGGVPEAEWLKFIAGAGFDGWEEASWELDLRRCDTDSGAADYAKERVALAKQHGLEIFTVATHLQGQVLGDEPSAKTLNFCSGKGQARAAYKEWRKAAARYAGHLSKLQNRKVALPGFVGSPAHCWSHWFLFPWLPGEMEGYPIPDVYQVSLELLVERFGPVWNECKKYGITYDLECHPSERAMGDLASASDYINHMNK